MENTVYVMPIGHDFHFFWSWKSHGKSFLKKSGHPEDYAKKLGTYFVEGIIDCIVI